MKEKIHISTILILLGCSYLVSAQVSNVQDTLGLRNRIDSAFSLQSKNFKSSVTLTAKTLETARNSKSQILISKVLYNAAILDWYDGVHPQALKKIHEFIALSKQAKDTIQIAKGFSQLGLIYLYTADYDSSLYYFDRSMRCHNVLNDTTQIIKNYGFKGLVYSLQGDI